MLLQARRSVAVVVLVVGLVTQPVGPWSAAAPGTIADLPFDSFADLHVDRQRERVFVTGGPGSTVVQVFDFDGRPAGRIDALPGAADMLADGDLLYIALSDTSTIAVVDLASLEVVDNVDIAPFTGPLHLSLSNDTIYFSYSCTGTLNGGFGSVDLATRTPERHVRPNPSVNRCARHAVVPWDPTTMFVWDEHGSALRRYDVSARHPILEQESQNGGFFDQLVFSKDAATFFALLWQPAIGGSTVTTQRRVDDMSEVASYPNGGAGVALGPRERIVFTGNVDGIHAKDVFVYRAGNSRPASSNEISRYLGERDEIQPGSLGTTPSGDRVFAVTRAAGSPPGDARFHVVWPRYGVAGGPALQSLPAATTRYTVWSHQPRGAKLETLVARAGRRSWRVNPRGTSGYAGGIEGSKLVYQVVRGGSSDLRLYDLARRRHVSTLDRLNTRWWEWRPTISGGRILFSRYEGRREKVILHTLRTGAERVLADVPERTHQAVAGQLSGPWAVWSQCHRACLVIRQNLNTGQKVRVPGPRGRVDYGASVTRDGVVYFGRSGNGCGTEASLRRYHDGRVTTIQNLPGGQDFFSSYAVPGTSTVMFDLSRCKGKYAWDIVSVRDVPR